MPFSEGLVASVLDIAFTTADGSRVTTILPYGYGTPPAEGSLIEILYDPGQPQDVQPVDVPAMGARAMDRAVGVGDPSRRPAAPALALTGAPRRHLLLGIGAVVVLFGLLTALGRDPPHVTVGLLIVAAFAGSTLFRRHRDRMLREDGVRVQGVVLGFQLTFRDGRRYRRPVVSFTAADGQEITVELRGIDPGLIRGQRVALVHAPGRPERVALESTLSDRNSRDWIFPAFGALFAAMLIFPELSTWVSDLRLPTTGLDGSASGTATKVIIGLLGAGVGYYILDAALIRLRRGHEHRFTTTAALILGPTLIAIAALVAFAL